MIDSIMPTYLKGKDTTTNLIGICTISYYNYALKNVLTLLGSADDIDHSPLWGLIEQDGSSLERLTLLLRRFFISTISPIKPNIIQFLYMFFCQCRLFTLLVQLVLMPLPGYPRR